MIKKLRAAVIGLGAMGGHHLRVLSSLPGTEVVAICDPDRNRHIPGTWTQHSNYQEINTTELDYCVIASPTDTHFEIARHMFWHSVPMLIEKPAVMSAMQARELIRIKSQCSGYAMVGMIERFNQTAQEAREITQSGRFGDLLRITTRRVGPAPGRDMGVGVLHDLGIHDLDLVQWISNGQLQDSNLLSILNATTNLEDLALVTGQLKSGALVTVELSWLYPVKQRLVELLFSSGAVSLNLLSGEVSVTEKSGKATEWEVSRELMGTSSARSLVYRVKTIEPLVAQHRALQKAVLKNVWSSLPSLEESELLLRLIGDLHHTSTAGGG